MERANGRIHAATDPGAALAEQRRRSMIETTHIPDRPSWRCRDCRAHWPCAPARADMIETMDRTARVIYVSLQMAEAGKDQPRLSAEELFARFIDWARAPRAEVQTRSNDSM